MTAVITTSTSAFRLLRNVTILGPPGSGKGFYGHLLAQAWNVPLITTSDVLRQRQQQHSRTLKSKSPADQKEEALSNDDNDTSDSSSIDLDSGRLADCQMVSDVLLEYVLHKYPHQNQPYLLDGFPRTVRQIELMTAQWPSERQVHVALQLDIPDVICVEKSAGRRVCRVCGRFPNTAHVQTADGFDLPPTRPETCQNRCDPDHDWTRRPDDAREILRERLKLHRAHEQPIIDYYRQRNALLPLVPYKGLPDVPWMRQQAEEWLTSVVSSESSQLR